jgi:hypothetical protein
LLRVARRYLLRDRRSMVLVHPEADADKEA